MPYTGFSTRHMRGRPSEPSVAYPGTLRRNPNAACACRCSRLWMRAHAGKWAALSRKMFGRSRHQEFERIPERIA
eukprot:1150081-Pleurochrysis_carterae.AAC.1